MREPIPSFGIQPPFLGAKNPLVSPQNYLGKFSQSLLIRNKYLNQSYFDFQPLLDSQLSSDLVQRSPHWDAEFNNSELPFSEYLQVNESNNRVERTKAEFQELSPTKVYAVEELPLDFTASDTPSQTSTKRKNTRKTTKAKSKTKTPTRKTTSKKTVPDVVKQAHPSINSNPQRQKKRRSKIDFLLEQRGLGEDVTLAAETINSTSEQNLQIYSLEDLPFQPTALEQSITPIEKETQFVVPAEPVNTDSSPATIKTPIQAPIPESHQESTLDAVSTPEEIVSSSTHKQSDRQLATAEQIVEQTIASSDRQLATAEQIVEQTIASSDRTFEPIENSPSQPTRDVKSKAARLQQSTEQKTGITLNQDVDTTATATIPPTSPLPDSYPNLEKQQLHLPLEQKLKQVEGEESPVAEIESNIISSQQLTQSNIVPSNLEVTNSSTVEPRDRSNEPQDISPSQIQKLDTSLTPLDVSSLQPPVVEPQATPLLFTIPEASQEIQPNSTIPVLTDTVDRSLFIAANAAPEQIIAQGGSNEPQDNCPSQTQKLDNLVTPLDVSSLQQPVTQPPTTPLRFTTPAASQEIQPASTIPVLPDTVDRSLLQAAVDSQHLPSLPDAAPQQIVDPSVSNEPQDNCPSQTQKLDNSVTPLDVSSLQQPVAQPPTTPQPFTIPAASQEIQPASTIPVLPDTVDRSLLQAAVDSQHLPSVPDATPQQIVDPSVSNEPQDNSPSQTQKLDNLVTPLDVSSVQQSVTQPPTTPLRFTTPAASQEIQPASTIPVLPDTVDRSLLQAAVDSQHLPSLPDAAPQQIVDPSVSNEPQDNCPSQTQKLDTSVTPLDVLSIQQPVTQPLALDVSTTASGAKQIYPTSIDEIDEEESSVTEITRNTISNQQLTESDLIPSQKVISSSIEPRDRDAIPQESAVPSVVKPRRHVSAPNLPVKQSRNLQQQDRFEAEFTNQAAHPTFQTEPTDSIASANSQQPPIQQALLERTISDRETPSSQPEPGNESIDSSPQQSATQAETESVFPSQVPPQGFAVGGAVPASSNLSSKPIAASDTVPAMLTPGEFVVNATDAQKHLNILHHINKGGAVEILPEVPTKVESSDSAKDPQTAPSSVQRKISHTSLPKVVKTLIPPIQLAEEPAAAKNRVTQPDPLQSQYAATELIYRKPASTSSAPPDSIPDRWDSIEDLLFGGTASDNSYTSDSMAVPRSYSNRNATPSNPGTSETIVSSVQPQGFAKGGAVAPDTFTPAQAIAHTIEAPASPQNKANSKDLEMLAREVYHRLRQRLELERERHGFYSGRLPW